MCFQDSCLSFSLPSLITDTSFGVDLSYQNVNIEAVETLYRDEYLGKNSKIVYLVYADHGSSTSGLKCT